MKTISFKKKLLASAIGTYALAGFSGVAMAQDTQPMVAEEVVVTGIRASLSRAMDIKRDSQGVVDAISAEDIGKFPDTNLAESLQRITGVSIDRRDGEGSKVTVRGLGPDFNLITLNGRQMPGATIEDTFSSGSRSFDFGNIASEGVKRVEVLKTARADVVPGGMGATINIVTPRPLDDQPAMSIGVKGVYDTSNEDTTITPEVSGIYSDVFMDGKLGVAATFAYQNREAAVASASVPGDWHSMPGTVDMNWGAGTAVWGGINADTSAPFPEDEDVYSTPQNTSYAYREFERTRINGQLTLQYAVTDDIEATLDYLVTSNELEGRAWDAGAWYNLDAGRQRALFSNNGTPAVETPLLYTEDSEVGVYADDLPFGSNVTAADYDNRSLGFNIEWSVNDRLTLAFDAHSSTAEAGPGSPYGTNAGIAASAYARENTTTDYRGDAPVLYLDLADTDELYVSGSFFRSGEMTHEVEQFQFDGDFELNDDMTIGFGLAHTQQNFESSFSNSQRDTWGGLGKDSGTTLPQDFFTVETIWDKLEDASVPTLDDTVLVSDFTGDAADTQTAADFLGLNNTDPFNTLLRGDFEAIRAFAVANFDTGMGTADCKAQGLDADAEYSSYYCAPAPNKFDTVDEDQNSAYVQFDWNLEVAGMEAGVNAGLRYEETDVTAGSRGEISGPLTWVGDNELNLPDVGPSLDVTAEGSTDHWLPSLDLRLSPLDDLVLRASASKSLTRPNFQDLRGLRFGEPVRPAEGQASQGNPNLLPYESTNFDLSAEFYYGDASYVSLGLFQKEVENFITTETTTVTGLLPNGVNPSAGPRANNPAVLALVAGGMTTRAAIVEVYGEDPERQYTDEFNIPTVIGITEGELADPLQVWQLSNKINLEGTETIQGVEFAVQHTFGDTGFGVIANYTYVDEDNKFNDLNVTDPQSGITGASDTANLVAFYDKSGLQARIAYNWRDSFLISPSGANGNNPQYAGAYGQIDMNVSYDVTDNLSVFVEGLNVAGADRRDYGRSERQVLRYYEGHARYNLGARYSF